MGVSLTDVTLNNASLRSEVYEEGSKTAAGDKHTTKNQLKRQQKAARKQVKLVNSEMRAGLYSVATFVFRL